jgi:hypothetical protein
MTFHHKAEIEAADWLGLLSSTQGIRVSPEEARLLTVGHL